MQLNCVRILRVDLTSYLVVCTSSPPAASSSSWSVCGTSSAPSIGRSGIHAHVSWHCTTRTLDWTVVVMLHTYKHMVKNESSKDIHTYSPLTRQFLTCTSCHCSSCNHISCISCSYITLCPYINSHTELSDAPLSFRVTGVLPSHSCNMHPKVPTCVHRISQSCGRQWVFKWARIVPSYIAHVLSPRPDTPTASTIMNSHVEVQKFL